MKTNIWNQSTRLKHWAQELESSLHDCNGNSATDIIIAVEDVVSEVENCVSDILVSLRDLREKEMEVQQ